PAIRSYTLSDAPGGAHYRITVKREGRVSAWLHDHAQAGMTLDAQMPRGRFTFDVASPRPAVLVSAGIGITPILAMARELASSGRPFTLHYAARDAESMAYRDEVAALPGATCWFDDGEPSRGLPLADAIGAPE
ncbi:hypothetical protein M3651_28185, partial [Cytobacillus oceanisediminis]|nr:hypothetical protein [Cytobacillus oceanisediminis]